MDFKRFFGGKIGEDDQYQYILYSMNTCFDCQVLVKKDKKIRKKKLKMSINSANEERVRNTVNRRQKNQN